MASAKYDGSLFETRQMASAKHGINLDGKHVRQSRQYRMVAWLVRRWTMSAIHDGSLVGNTLDNVGNTGW